jgi:hypothetical protein
VKGLDRLTTDSLRLREFVDGTLDWVAANLAFFDPFLRDSKPDILRSKAIAELAFTCEYYYRSVTGGRDSRIDRALQFIHEIWQRPEYKELVIRNPESLQLYALTYNSLLGCGFVDPSYGEIIQRVIDQGYATAVEAVPFRTLDLRHVLDHGGFRHQVPSFHRLYGETLLGKMPPLVYLTDGDAYCITHTLFYLGDFGFQAIDAIPNSDIPAVQWTTGMLLGIYLRAEDWDLVAELLLSCLCLRWIPPVIFISAWNALLDAQLPDGSVPAPKFSPEKVQLLNEAEWRRYCFEENYHTTLVGGLAGFMYARWLNAPLK